MNRGTCLICFAVNVKTYNIKETQSQFVFEEILDFKVQAPSHPHNLCYICHIKFQQCFSLVTQTLNIQMSLKDENIQVEYPPLVQLSTVKVLNTAIPYHSLTIKQEPEVKEDSSDDSTDVLMTLESNQPELSLDIIPHSSRIISHPSIASNPPHPIETIPLPPRSTYSTSTTSFQRHKNSILEKEYRDRFNWTAEILVMEKELLEYKIREDKAKSELAALILERERSREDPTDVSMALESNQPELSVDIIQQPCTSTNTQISQPILSPPLIVTLPPPRIITTPPPRTITTPPPYSTTHPPHSSRIIRHLSTASNPPHPIETIPLPPRSTYSTSTTSFQRHKNSILEKEYRDRFNWAAEILVMEKELLEYKIREDKAKSELAALILERERSREGVYLI